MSADNTKEEIVEEKQENSEQTEEAAMGPPKEIPPAKNIEKEQEAKLRARYPGLKAAGTNPLLQKRLSKGQQKYFDSGDYNMAKAGIGGKKPIPTGQKLLLLGGETGSAHPTPETIPIRKASLIPVSSTPQHLS
jgi:hypothetical protein